MKKLELDLQHTDALKFNIFLSNGQINLVSCLDEDTSMKCIFTIGWIGPVSFSPFLLYASIGNGQSKDDIMSYRYSYAVIKNSKVIGLNLPDFPMLETAIKIGSAHSDEVDKFKENNLTAFTGKFTKVPMIEECLINVECKVIDELKTGDHDTFILEPLSIFYNEDVFVEGRFTEKYKDKNNQIHAIDALPQFV